MLKYPDVSKLHIVHYPAPVLRARAEDIREVSSFLKELAERMGELMGEAQGVGLAANQVGWPYRFVILNPTLEPGKVEAFINPVIITKEGRMVEEEGCLSVPGIHARVRRAEKVRVRATRRDGEKVEMAAEGLLARAWQHEIDHLDGMLFVDRVRPGARVLLAGQLRYLERIYEEAAGETGHQP